ncbi:MAG: hypothetical protein WBC85_12865 [Planktotalea sp.]|uniref:hypothetical protein n=1 Tax=Planktotalea sp. TaxID=2029877 RepID=UPI003C732266
MNRRTFNTGLVGGAVAAVMPIPAAAKAVSATQSGPLYAWAVAIARAQNRASPTLLAHQLRISQAAASELYASLIANGVIRAPLFGGMAKASEPLFRGSKLRVVKARLGEPARAKLNDIKQALDRVVSEDAPELETDASGDQAT